MSHPFFWPDKYFFYPIGNTSAVSLTRDLAPDQSADLLLLGCGDPRHILYTLFSEPDSPTRKLDFTCVDFEPAVLARNVLLFTLIADNTSTDTVWNIFYHMHLDVNSHSALIQQCRKLVDAAQNMAVWRSSPYGAYIRASTEHTLSEIRRHWSLYLAFPHLAAPRQKAIRDAYARVFTRALSKNPMTSVRSAGPLIQKAVTADTNVVKNYWTTGTTFLRPREIASAKLINPTFAYSLVGEGCAVHYGTDPLTAFHSATLFGNANASPTASDLVRTAKEQFSAWCAAFLRIISHMPNMPRIRVFLAEVTAACHALRSFFASGALKLGIPVAQFTTQIIHLDHNEYVSDGGPASFDVIETSNLVDHVGLLNILVAAVPLLRLPGRPSASVLYTESLLFRGEDATKEFADLLFADIGTMGMLLNLCPIDYLSGFTTRSNTHEIIVYQLMKTSSHKTMPSQFHQVTTWKSPVSCDSAVALCDGRTLFPPSVDARQLGTLLFDIYHAVFEQEDARTFWMQNQDNLSKAISTSNILHYMRESFVLFLKLVRERLRIPRAEWLDVMDRFLDLESSDATMPMNTVNRNDFYAHLHRQGVYTVEHYRHHQAQKIGRFAGWDFVPPVVRVVLSIPREKIDSFEANLAATSVGTPPIQCDVLGTWSHNIFCSVHVAYGRAISVGTDKNPRTIFEEDLEGRKGSLPLVVSFVLPAMLLTEIEPPQNLKVRMCVRSTTGTVPLHAKLGFSLEVFSASLMDKEHVHILPETQLPIVDFAEAPSAAPVVSPNTSLRQEIGRQGTPAVELDEQCELVSSLTTRVDIEDDDVVRGFGSGAMPTITQRSPCIMQLSVVGHFQDVVFPFPIVGSQNRLRLARKSRYIEVVVPIAGPFLKPDGMKFNPFPVVGSGKVFLPWNVHRLSLNRLPLLNLKGSHLEQWLNPHVGSMLSVRERKMRKKHKADGLLFVKDTLQAIFARSTGIQGGAPVRVFALRDEVTNNCDTIFFISDLRYDLHCHTVVCDSYVLPLTHDLMPKIASFFGRLVNDKVMENVRIFEGEMEAWKQLIPAFVERCRTWEHTDNCEYLARTEVPLTLKMELDPLCSCGRGKDVDALLKVPEWRRYAPYVTRLALSPLFAVSYLETVGRDPAAYKCSVCRGKGKPKLMACKACQKARYCSVACQKKDWPRHKTKCKA